MFSIYNLSVCLTFSIYISQNFSFPKKVLSNNKIDPYFVYRNAKDIIASNKNKKGAAYLEYANFMDRSSDFHNTNSQATAPMTNILRQTQSGYQINDFLAN